MIKYKFDNIHNAQKFQLLANQLLIECSKILYKTAMSYQRTPPQFMKGIFIAPHNFNDPQHPEHGEYVNMQMKNDLYKEALYKITACEFSLFGSEEQQLQVTKIANCEGSDPLGGVASKLTNSRLNSDQNQLICCQDWRINRIVKSGQSTSKYRVKIYQSKKDLFYSEIHPPSPWKLFKFYLFN